MTEVHRKAVAKDPHGFTHVIYNKETNEPILGLKKSSWGNDYSAAVHPEFKDAHGDNMHMHELNYRAGGAKGPDLDGKARSMHNEVYNGYYNPKKKVTYKYIGASTAGDGNERHEYHIYDPDGDKVMTAHLDAGPSQIRSASAVRRIENVNTDKYDIDTHYAAAKTKFGNGNIDQILKMAAHMHENKDKAGPRFIGHETSPARHKSFKTRLPDGEAVKAYVDHLKKSGSLGNHHQVLSQDDNHSLIHDGNKIHTITHHEGTLHHVITEPSWGGPAKNSSIIENYAK